MFRRPRLNTKQFITDFLGMLGMAAGVWLLSVIVVHIINFVTAFCGVYPSYTHVVLTSILVVLFMLFALVMNLK